MSAVWKVLLAGQAELDLLEITVWTLEKFGDKQADEYAETISLAIEALHDGPEILGVKERDDIGLGICTFHVASHGRKGRHFVVFKSSAAHQIEVSRLLHDSMNLARHLPLSNADKH